MLTGIPQGFNFYLAAIIEAQNSCLWGWWGHPGVWAGAPCTELGVEQERCGESLWTLNSSSKYSFQQLFIGYYIQVVYLQIWSCFSWRALTVESPISDLPFESSVIFSCFLLLATSAAEIGPWGFKAAAWLRKRRWIKAPCSAPLPLLYRTPSCVSPAARKGSWPWSESKEEREWEEERWSQPGKCNSSPQRGKMRRQRQRHWWFSLCAGELRGARAEWRGGPRSLKSEHTQWKGRDYTPLSSWSNNQREKVRGTRRKQVRSVPNSA